MQYAEEHFTDRPWINFLHADAQSAGDVLHRLIVLRDDSDALSNRLSGDRMIPGHHDHLDACRAALGHGVGHCSAWWVDHRHQTHEAQPSQRKVLRVRVERITNRIPTNTRTLQSAATSDKTISLLDVYFNSCYACFN